jgi:hypothetical protein
MLTNVPGDVTNVEVSIYSPDHKNEDRNSGVYGDSFFVSGVIADVDKVEEEEGCTLTWGYWKTHSSCKEKGPKRNDTWDKVTPDAESSTFFLSGLDYCGVLDTEPEESKYYILAHQYIAAQLNMLNDASGSAIASTFNEATNFFSTYEVGDVNNDENLQSKAVDLGAILDDYNKGLIGPGHCDDNEEKTAIVSKAETGLDLDVGFNIYPNPASDFVTIRFKPENSVNTKVILYNLYGQSMDVLYNNVVERDREREIKYNVEKLTSGLYFVKIINGSSTLTKKIIVSK